jgi:putative transposase
VSTRRVDDLSANAFCRAVQAMGLSGIGKSTVSKLCNPIGECKHSPVGQGDIDERVGGFLDRRGFKILSCVLYQKYEESVTRS